MDSADEARRFLQGHGVPEDSIRRVWTAIALHPRLRVAGVSASPCTLREAEAAGPLAGAAG